MYNYQQAQCFMAATALDHGASAEQKSPTRGNSGLFLTGKLTLYNGGSLTTVAIHIRYMMYMIFFCYIAMSTDI